MVIAGQDGVHHVSGAVLQCILGVFVGGQSSRMGGFPKGMIQHPRTRTRTLVEHWAALAQALSIPCVLVGRHSAYLRYGLPVLLDKPSGVGPIGGLHALLEYGALCASWVVAVACDMPFASEDLTRQLCTVEPEAAIVAPRKGPSAPWEPLFARYAPQSVCPALEAQLAQRQHSLQSLINVVGGTPLAMTSDDWVQLVDWDCPLDVRAKHPGKGAHA